MGGAAALDGDDERSLLGAGTVADMTHVLARVRGRHLGDPQPGAHDLRGSRCQGVRAAPPCLRCCRCCFPRTPGASLPCLG